MREAERFKADQEHLRQLPESYNQFRTAFALQMLTAKVLAIIVAPIMPDFSGRLWKCVMNDVPMLWGLADSFIAGKTPITAPQDRFFVPVLANNLNANTKPKAA